MKTYKTTVLILVPALLLLSSCTREEVIDSNAWKRQSDHICFGISPKTENVLTKGGSDHLVMRSADSDDTLCVRVTVSDGIDGQPFAEKAPGTRAAQITSIREYGGFHVQAHSYTGSYTGSTLDEEFYIDDDVEIQNGNIWSSAKTYFWPGSGRTLDFYAWAPADAAKYRGLTVPESPSSGTTLTYTVPLNVADQKDISIATATDIQGDSYTSVPLTFYHIFTAVKFVVGDQMQPGTIERVALTGVYNRGTYDMAAAGNEPWELDESSKNNFEQSLDSDMNGNEPAGEEITSNEGTFMMLPQTLPEGAMIKVVFHDQATGTNRTLTASIAGTEWPMGKTVTYSLSITPDYELEFISEPESQDAHYVIYPIHIKAGEMPGEGGWTVTSSDPNVTLRTELTVLQQRGYWIKYDTDGQSITSSAVGEDITIYAFLSENVTEEMRNVTLELRPTSLENAQPQTFTISQLCPSWNGNLGCERIEDGDYPWGFCWDNDVTITYDVPSLEWGHILESLLLNIYLAFFDDSEYISVERGFLGVLQSVSFDFSKVPPPTNASNPDDGKANTEELYNFKGLSDASALIAVLEQIEATPDKELPLNPTEFAARACAMKNEYDVEVTSQDGETVERAVLKELKWYLPARNEATRMEDTDYPLNGEYWTSTAAENDNENAYKLTTTSSTTIWEKRDMELHVRAVRQKP